MATLILEEDGKSITYTLAEGETIVGRRPGTGIHLIGGTVSGTHAKLTRQGDEVFLEDLGSRNGTAVNGVKVSEKLRLNHNDEVSFGRTAMRFENPNAAPPPAPDKTKDTVSMTEEASKTLVLDEDEPNIGGEAFKLDIDNEEESGATIVGAVENKGRFGMLDTNPEAKLKAVLEISSNLAGTVDLDAMLPKILDSLFGIFPYADRGCILLKEHATGKMIPRAIKHRRADRDESVRLSRTIVNKVLEEKTGVLSADASTDQQFQGSESISELKIRSMMCVPMLDLKGEPAGIVSIDSQNPLGQFQQEDLDLLMVVAAQAAIWYKTARLLESYIAKQKQDREMDIARDVQLALLPDDLPKAEGYEFYASYDSAQAVGGDYYDCFALPGDKIALSFGDVAGKGVPGLIMSRMSTVVQTTLKHVFDVGEAAMAINQSMCDKAVAGRFVTYVLVIIDLNKHEMQMINAGHMSPFLRNPDGTVEEIVEEDLAGPPIGVVDEYPYDVVTRPIHPGETVVIVTDGVDEAMNRDGEFYGKERVIEFISKSSPNADELGKSLLADVRSHADGWPQNDDITIMTFGRNA